MQRFCIKIINGTILLITLYATQTMAEMTSCIEIVSPEPYYWKYTISEPGAYCLHQDYTGGIYITADNVVLDLNSYTIHAQHLSNGSPLIGVDVRGSRTIVKNGAIIDGSLGVDSIGSHNVFENLTIDNMTGSGIQVGYYASTNNIIRRNTISNTGNNGIYCGGKAGEITSNSIRGFGENASTPFGIYVACNRSVVKDNIVDSGTNNPVFYANLNTVGIIVTTDYVLLEDNKLFGLDKGIWANDFRYVKMMNTLSSNVKTLLFETIAPSGPVVQLGIND